LALPKRQERGAIFIYAFFNRAKEEDADRPAMNRVNVHRQMIVRVEAKIESVFLMGGRRSQPRFILPKQNR